MKKILFALTGAAIFAVVSASAPASAMPAQPTMAGTVNNIVQIQSRGHRHWRRHHPCWTERVVRRNRSGRRVIVHRRVCH